MKLLNSLLEHLQSWDEVLPQRRTLDRTFAMGIGILCGVGKRTITRSIGFHGNTQKDWSADYKLFSRSPWEPRALFAPILREAIGQYRLERIVLSVDDTRVWRTGLKVPQTQWHWDPLGPAFHPNLRWGHRFLQASLVLPLYREKAPGSARSLPVRWEMAPVVKKPGKRATDPEWKAYAQEKKEKNLSRQFVSLVQELREHLNATGQAGKVLVVVGDGSFCNRTVLAQSFGQDVVVGGAQKGHGLGGITLMDGLATDGILQALGLAVESQAQGGGLAQHQAEQEIIGVDFSLALDEAVLASQPVKGFRLEPVSKIFDKRSGLNRRLHRPPCYAICPANHRLYHTDHQ